MSKRKHSTPPAAPHPVAPALVFSKTRSWLIRLALAIFVPALFFLTLESVLRWSGFGHPTSFLVRSPDGQAVVPNWCFGWQFFSPELSIYPFPFRMPLEKPPGARRIFVLGESAAQGTPDPSFGFARILQVMLDHQFPTNKIEIYNAALRGIDSHVIRLIAQDCARYQPDLFLIYMGNNEAIGLHSPDPDSSRVRIPITFVRFGQALKSSRLGQLFKSALAAVGKKEPTTQDMEYFRKNRLPADDPRRQATYAWFQANLEAICQIATQAGAKTLVSTIPVNLQDFPPLGSLHRANLTEPGRARWETLYQQGSAAEIAGQFAPAITQYLEAARLDDHFAELHFRLGRCYLASNQLPKAREHFQLACDWDALHFRIDRTLNDILRLASTRKETQGIFLVDAENAFAKSPLSDNSIPGRRLFNDHVHLSFDGDYLLASTFLPAIASALGLTSNRLDLPTRQQCAAWLAFSPWDEVNVSAAMVKALNKPPFLDQLEHEPRQARAGQTLQQSLRQFNQEQFQKALATYQAAITRQPQDWQLHHNFGNFFSDMKNTPAAIEELRLALKLSPQSPVLMVELGHLLRASGQAAEAQRLFQDLLRLYPGFPPAREGLRE